MSEIDAILESYRRADLEARLDIFLNHRDLRPLFDGIEAEEGFARSAATASVPEALPAGRKADVAPLRRLMRGCCL